MNNTQRKPFEVIKTESKPDKRFEGFAIDDPHRDVHKMPVKPHFGDNLIDFTQESLVKKAIAGLPEPKKRQKKVIKAKPNFKTRLLELFNKGKK
jgi:hypothetical protein